MINKIIDAIFFDMDNTLVETEWAAAKAVSQVVEELGKTFDPDDDNFIIGHSWENVFNFVIDKYAADFSHDDLKNRILAKKDVILKNNLRTIPGAVKALKLLANYFPVAVVSGSYRIEVEETMEQLGVSDLVNLIVANEDVSPGKPNPAPYLAAAKKLGVDPKKCIVFEDSEIGIESANNAGCLSVAIEYANKNMNLDNADIRMQTLEFVDENWIEQISTLMEKKMIKPYNGIMPKLADDVLVLDGAKILGDVEIDSGSSIWFNSVIRGDTNIIRIGKNVNIQDLSMVHVTHQKYSLTIKDDVTVGHKAMLHGCVINSRVLVGMGAIVLDGAIIGEDSIIGAGSLVLERSEFPPGVLIVGSPAKVKRKLTPEEIASIAWMAPHYRILAENYFK